MRSHFTHRGWSIRRVPAAQVWGIWEAGQRSGHARANIWRASDGSSWLCDGGRSAIADARLSFEAALDLAIDRITRAVH